MQGLNRAMLIGNLGQDPDLKYTQSDKAVMTLSLATGESWKDKESGERVEKTEWHRIVLWGDRAEALAKILRKGMMLYIEGRIQTRKWEDNDGRERYTTEIVADDVIFLTPKGSSKDSREEEKAPGKGAKNRNDKNGRK